MKEEMIKNYIASIDFNRDWKLSEITEKLKKLLSESPAIDIIYRKDVQLNEVNGKAKEIEKVEKVIVIFTNDDNNFKKLEFRID